MSATPVIAPAAPAVATPADAPIGIDSLNRPVVGSFQPSVASLALALTPHLGNMKS